MAEIQPSKPASVPTASDEILSQVSMSASGDRELMRAISEPINGAKWLSFMVSL